MVRKLTGRSSLVSHSFPPFYACYLLKSIRTPQSQATYIGSTPSPPRRIRQHNGEITQGAWKTQKNRPWVMQMIVHGFPSKLAALQFEWAWQHPHISRHLRDQEGNALFVGNRKSKYLAMNIQILRIMLSQSPFNTWPLHVKLFTEQAVKIWNKAMQDIDAHPLPPGLTCSIELEGVDGKSGKLGSGRTGPINVKDEQFTSAHLSKNTTLLASNRHLTCSICNELVVNYATDPLTTALCPRLSCTAVSHLLCLSRDFLSSQSNFTGIIPRGGECKSCNTYILWGDVIRGCYRRALGGVVCEPEDDAKVEDCGEVFDPNDDLEESSALSIAQVEHKVANPVVKSAAARKNALQVDQGEGEFFDYEGLSGSSVDGPIIPPTRKRGRRPKVVEEATVPTASKMPKKTRTKAKPPSTTKIQDGESEGEAFDFDGISGSSVDEEGPPGKPRRPRKVSSKGRLGETTLPVRKRSKVATTKRFCTEEAPTQEPNDSGEFFDFNGIDDIDSDERLPELNVGTTHLGKSSRKHTSSTLRYTQGVTKLSTHPEHTFRLGSGHSSGLAHVPSPPTVHQKHAIWKHQEPDLFDEDGLLISRKLAGDHLRTIEKPDKLVRAMSILSVSSSPAFFPEETGFPATEDINRGDSESNEGQQWEVVEVSDETT